MSDASNRLGLSRADVETACLLLTVRTPGTPAELAERLGLGPTLAPAVAHAYAPLLAGGSVADDDGAWRLTPAGKAQLTLLLERSSGHTGT